MKKVVILALHLNYGGVEKFISDVANVLSEENDVTIISTYKVVDKPFFAINENVKIKYLTSVNPNRIEFFKALESKNPFRILFQGIKATNVLFKKKFTLKKFLKSVDCNVIITTRYEQSMAVSKYCSGDILKIGTEHNHHNDSKKYIKRIFNASKSMDKLVLLSEELHKDYTEIFKNEKVECENIKHFVKHTGIENRPKNEVISVGRLSIEKGYTDLLKVAKQAKDITFNIVGSGIMKEDLQQQIKRDKLNNVILHGSLNDEQINSLSEKCFANVMTSISESFGLVLIESLASGIPCVAFDSAKGPCEIIENGVNGFLVSDRNVDEFVKKMYECRDNFEVYSENALKIVDVYSYDTFYENWNNIVK